MWVLLSSRLRTWLALAVLLPLVRAVLRRIAAARPGSPLAARLVQVDAFLARAGGRGRGRRGRRR
jgi:hypothetical protein